jgi:hypothetical protein
MVLSAKRIVNISRGFLGGQVSDAVARTILLKLIADLYNLVPLLDIVHLVAMVESPPILIRDGPVGTVSSGKIRQLGLQMGDLSLEEQQVLGVEHLESSEDRVLILSPHKTGNFKVALHGAIRKAQEERCLDKEER